MTIKANQAFEVVLTLSEGEARALDALVGYGGNAFVEMFLKTFYERLGKHYMQPYESDLKKLFENIRNNVRFSLHKIDKAKDIFSSTNKNY